MNFTSSLVPDKGRADNQTAMTTLRQETLIIAEVFVLSNLLLYFPVRYHYETSLLPLSSALLSLQFYHSSFMVSMIPGLADPSGN